MLKKAEISLRARTEEAMKNAELKKVELSQRVEKMKLTSSYDDITDIYHDTSQIMDTWEEDDNDCTEDIISKSISMNNQKKQTESSSSSSQTSADKPKEATPVQQQPTTQSTQTTTKLSSISEMLKKAEISLRARTEEAMKNAELKKVELSQRVEKMKLTSSYDDITDIYHDTSQVMDTWEEDDMDTKEMAELKYEEEKKKRNKINDIVVTFSHDKKN